jgi:hypothetical protein
MNELYAEHAAMAYRGMLTNFRKRDGMYRYDEGPRFLRSGAQLWPFGRALAATLDVAGISSEHSAEAEAAVPEHLQILERYWDPAGPKPAYCADVRGASRRGDRYYDDNAWIGLALMQLERMRPELGQPDRARELFEFAAAGWASEAGGGVYWVEQGRGTGIRNHDRGTVSNAPNAELGLHLRELGHLGEAGGQGARPEDMYDWVLRTLDRSRAGESPGTGLFWDKVRGDGTIDRATWSYNQGGMIGANVLLARLHPEDGQQYLDLAGSIARKALREGDGAYRNHPPAFNAIFFRNLLLLHHASEDEVLQGTIIDAIRGYADAALSESRDRQHLFHMRGRPVLLDQSAMVQVLALLAWDPESYGRLA